MVYNWKTKYKRFVKTETIGSKIVVHPWIVVWIWNGYSCKSLLLLVSWQTSLHCATFHHFALSFLFLFSFFFFLSSVFCFLSSKLSFSLSLSTCTVQYVLCYVVCYVKNSSFLFSLQILELFYFVFSLIIFVKHLFIIFLFTHTSVLL